MCSHIFIECPYSSEILELVAIWSGCANLASTNLMTQHERRGLVLQNDRAGDKDGAQPGNLNSLVYSDTKKYGDLS